MEPDKQLQEWRAELVDEQTELEQKLAELRKELPIAEATAHAILEQAGDLQRIAARGLESVESMAGPLWGRLQQARLDARRAASDARGALRARVKSLQEQIAGRQLAIDQIDRALARRKVTNIHVVAGPDLRKPKPIDYDNITMPPQGVSHG